MKQTLHILKDSGASDAFGILGELLEVNPGRILLIQDSVRSSPRLKGPFLVLEEDTADGKPGPGTEAVNYSKMLELILESDRVMVW
jgi:hypothetical protein